MQPREGEEKVVVVVVIVVAVVIWWREDWVYAMCKREVGGGMNEWREGRVRIAVCGVLLYGVVWYGSRCTSTSRAVWYV